jgi:hypothetical protein
VKKVTLEKKKKKNVFGLDVVWAAEKKNLLSLLLPLYVLVVTFIFHVWLSWLSDCLWVVYSTYLVYAHFPLRTAALL